MTGVVVWITGLPASGKSTLAARLREHLVEAGRPSCILDGDAVRERLVPPPGHDEAARADYYASLANLAALLAEQDLVVLVPATAHRASFRAHARRVAGRFVEVYVDTPLAVSEARDPKGLYARARAGEIADLPGPGVPYEVPVAPDVVAHGADDAEAVPAILGLLLDQASSR